MACLRCFVFKKKNGAPYDAVEQVIDPTYDVRALTPERKSRLQKRSLIYFSPSQIEAVWEYLPKELQEDKDIQLRRPCYEHYNLTKDQDHIDGPAPSRLKCSRCWNKYL